MSTNEFEQLGAGALAQLLAEVLENPSQRRAFRKDPQGTADAAGIDISAIPERIVGMLADLSGAELRLLSEVNYELIREGLKVDVGGEGPEIEGGMAFVVRTLGVF
jgi:hypothetical protein